MKQIFQKHLATILIAICCFGAGAGAHWYLFTHGLERPVTGVTNTSEAGSLTKSLSLEEDSTDFAQFWNTWATLETYFAPAGTSSVPTSDDKVAAAIAGLVRSYNDPYTEFLPKVQADQLKETVRGDFEGIGAVLTEIPGQGIFVGQVIPDSPAEKAGLVPGDLITSVDGSNIVGQGVDAVVDNIRGPAGSEVKLTLNRENGAVEVPVTRGVVVIPTVASKVVSRLEEVADAIGGAVSAAISSITGGAPEPEVEERSYRLVRLTSFSGTSVEQLLREINAYAAGDERAFILDLRDNPGGDLAVATEIASHFLPEGAMVSTVRDHKGHEEYYKSKGYGTLDNKDGCVAVVVNGNSASASEILAAALGEPGVAKIVGDKTFGKGSVQQLVEVGDLGTLKITIAHWYTPNGISISKHGVTPEFPLDPESETTTGDPYIDTALEVCSA